MRAVTLETRCDGGPWAAVGGVCEAEPPGSLTSAEPGGRQVFVFGWMPNGEGPGVWRSTLGADSASSAVRLVVTTGFEQLADLNAGPHEQSIHRADGRAMEARFVLTACS